MFLSHSISLFLSLCLLTPRDSVQDVYLQNPRGSNNRLNERTRPRANANRLFDSQNNQRGGYNKGDGGPMSYYEASRLQIQWTNQHSCGVGAEALCEVIIQYKCGSDLRDGSSTNTITEQGAGQNNGRHESPDDFKACSETSRNLNLFTADQNLKRNDARATRQNPNGQRYGLECPEERDYYPYWRPTGWVDVAILTTDVTRCDFYKSESENVKRRFSCVGMNKVRRRTAKIPITASDCQSVGGRWTPQAPPQQPLPPPDCRRAPFSRDNHLGDVADGKPMSYNWTIPSADRMEGNCVLRIRYNISSSEFPGFDGAPTAALNAPSSNAASLLDVASRSGVVNREEAKKRGFVFENNPQVKIFSDLDLDLELAINTAQIGRVFQDRSHVFRVKSRDRALSDAKIHNVNVKGKRGNIVQVYPAVEYDFVPNTAVFGLGDYVHFQWTGANTNPNNNDGQGKAGTDRSNIVLQKTLALDMRDSDQSHWAVNYPAIVEKNLLGLDLKSKVDLALVGVASPGNELDNAPAYYDHGPVKITEPGVYHYLCTRNNNFSNRNQKARLLVSAGGVDAAAIGISGGELKAAAASLSVEAGAVAETVDAEMEVVPRDAFLLRLASARKAPPADSISNFVVIKPEKKLTSDSKRMRVKLKVLEGEEKVSSVSVFAATSSSLLVWNRLPASFDHETGVIEFESATGGVFFAARSSGGGVGVGVVIGVLFILGLVAGVALFLWRRRR